MNHAQAISLYTPTLQAIAYNLVRCKADAEDIVQETFLKWLTIDSEKIQNTKAYLIRAVTNNCLSHINSLRKKNEVCGLISSSACLLVVFAGAMAMPFDPLGS